MFRYLDLCVELKKGRYAKDGLIHYRNVCQQVNVSSLEEVIKYFLKSATDKAEDAQSKAAEAQVTIDVEDLEADASPEDLMLSYVSGEKGKDRTDRELVTPWFKFLWETYRSVMDILRNNSRLEALYAMTAAKAFQFCLMYKRTTEFRRLCDILRNHLANLNKYRDQRDRPDLSNPESLQLYLETRFEQLKVACELELWQEAFRSVEDIQGLSAIGKKPPKPQLMALYYAKLTQIFTVSEAHLYNGYAWYKLFNLAKSYNKNLGAADVQMMASSVLLAALSILPYSAVDAARSEAEAELEKDRSMRVANLLGFSVDARRDARSALSRGALVADLGAKGVLNLVPEEIKQIHALLEADFVPLELCARLSPLLDALEGLNRPLSPASPVPDAALGQYKRALQQVAVLRLLQQLSQVYSVMRVASLAALVPFFSFGEVEQFIVDAVKHNYLHVQIDHRNGTVHFGGQQLESERLRDHVAALARRLAKALQAVQPAPSPDKQARKAKALAVAADNAATLHAHTLARKVIIEKRKEEAERLLLEAEKKEEEQRAIQARLNEAAEEERRRAERVRRETERIQAELAERELEEARQMLEAAKKKGGAKGLKLKDGAPLNKQELINEVISEQQRAREESEKKLNLLIRRLDHLERARRELETPLLETKYAEQVTEDEKRHHDDLERFAEQHRAAWNVDVEERRRLDKMAGEKEKFAAAITSRRSAEFEALKRAREAALAAKRQERSVARALRRRQEYVRRCRLELEERRRKEEEEREREEAERRVREEAERAARLEEAAARQRAKEAEIEEKKRKEREALLAAPPAPAAKDLAGALGSAARRPGAVAAPADLWRPGGRASGGAPAAATAAAAPAEPEADRWAPRRGAAADMEPPRGERPAPAADRWRPGGARRDEPPPPAARREAAAAPLSRPGALDFQIEADKEIKATITLRNCEHSRVAFKVKTTNLTRYAVANAGLAVQAVILDDPSVTRSKLLRSSGPGVEEARLRVSVAPPLALRKIIESEIRAITRRQGVDGHRQCLRKFLELLLAKGGISQSQVLLSFGVVAELFTGVRDVAHRPEPYQVTRTSGLALWKGGRPCSAADAKPEIPSFPLRRVDKTSRASMDPNGLPDATQPLAEAPQGPLRTTSLMSPPPPLPPPPGFVAATLGGPRKSADPAPAGLSAPNTPDRRAGVPAAPQAALNGAPPDASGGDPTAATAGGMGGGADDGTGYLPSLEPRASPWKGFRGAGKQARGGRDGASVGSGGAARSAPAGIVRRLLSGGRAEVGSNLPVSGRGSVDAEASEVSLRARFRTQSSGLSNGGQQ
ncbi:hypothetical protein WJX81_007146 [Elliptochloris bilobata]|uniref:Eukaryotic translation initiation factor 3 subunit A n=1 Tax=Elliptochloris bilobata TaxID=381761 RepID=A0AAW1RIP7_9CHLO